eukprot:scaffold122227_cov63-Phaeocystis_antarctica.AAC.1
MAFAWRLARAERAPAPASPELRVDRLDDLFRNVLTGGAQKGGTPVTRNSRALPCVPATLSCRQGPARMGASASRLPELEAAQAQVRRVTAHLQRATASLAEESSKLSSVQTEAKTLRQQAGKLQGVQTELADANKLLKSARREAHELPQVRHALKVAQEAEAAARQASESKGSTHDATWPIARAQPAGHRHRRHRRARARIPCRRSCRQGALLEP